LLHTLPLLRSWERSGVISSSLQQKHFGFLLL
jgi:hypothetical protein